MIRPNENAKTSVFSEYENNQNDSLSSRQLEYWLKQALPKTQPKFSGNEWTLMSANSIYEQEEHSLQRNETYESLYKENDQLAFNSARPTIQNNSGVFKSKSYINAMKDLQAKAKQLQQDNSNLKTEVKTLREERNKVMQNECQATEQLKRRLQIMESKTKKMEQLVRDNKILRDVKQETFKKAKIFQKMSKQLQSKLVDYEKTVQSLQQQMSIKDDKIRQLQSSFSQQAIFLQKSRESIQKLQEKNKMLEDMKERSTSSIIEKYNKNVELVETLTKDNMKLTQEIQNLKEKSEDKMKNGEQRHSLEKDQLNRELQKAKQQLNEAKQSVLSLANQSNYFKQAYQKSNNDLILALKEHNQQIKKLNQTHQQQFSQLRASKQQQIILCRQKYLNQIQDFKLKQEQHHKQEDINQQSRIQDKQPQKIQIESRLEFQQFGQIQQQPVEEERRPLETRSLEKQAKISYIQQPSKSKPKDCLSQENNKVYQIVQPKSAQTRKSIHQSSKSRKLSQDQPISKERQSKSKSREKDRPFNHSNQASFILKSCEAATQQEHTDHITYSREPYFYNSANNPARGNPAHYWQPNEIAQFGFSQRGNASSSATYSLQKVLLVESNKQAIRLIEQQQKCIALLTENVTPNERAQNLGRMKQISQQIKINNQKMLDLKTKITQ